VDECSPLPVGMGESRDFAGSSGIGGVRNCLFGSGCGSGVGGEGRRDGDTKRCSRVARSDCSGRGAGSSRTSTWPEIRLASVNSLQGDMKNSYFQTTGRLG